MLIKRMSWCLTALVVTSVAWSLGCAGDGERSEKAPAALQAAPVPDQTLSGGTAAPPLCVASDVPGFIDWAGKTTVDQHETAARVIAAAGQIREVVDALIDEVETMEWRDHSRALLGLAILGEMRSPFATSFLQEFANRPLPQAGTVQVTGEILEQTARATLEAKAVDGLAYLRTAEGDSAVLHIVARHPSKIVRAEAINAFLWNHGDSAAARRQLVPCVREDERILIDRVRRGSGEGAASFNAKLGAFLEAHPEVVPPEPERFPRGHFDETRANR